MPTALANAANVAQVTGINAAGVIATVRGAPWKAWRAHENTKDDGEKLKRDVDMLEYVQRRLQEQEHNPLATWLLPRLEETLKEARDLMKRSSRMDRFINGSRLAERFRDVETKVNIIYLSSFPLLSCGTEEFTLAEVMAATNFTVVLSASDSATVYRGTLRDGREVAVKRLNNTGAGPGRAAVQDAFFTEVAILSLIHHDHIARLVGTCAYGDERIVVTHPCTGNGSLYDHLHGRRTRTSRVTASWEARVQVLLGAARAVEHLHCHAVPHIIHANVTSSAILLEGATWAPRLSDFGRAVWLEAGVESQAVDLAAAAEGYADPEHRSTGRLKPASDVYSLGVVMLEVLTGKPPVERVWDEGSGAMVTMGMDLVSFALPSIQHQQAGGGRLLDVLDRRPAPDPTAGQLQPLQMLANTAARCLRQCGDDRPPIRDVVADLEKALSLICPGGHLS
ncbi:hypothetical protein U9M48_001286 [Paspalum notatum var. saurae]|uniref:Protein kinase domain-containing protein n=1 Tax=Paspalum notatum var. saurae TaxID=547442 RepID=A0AAQ3SF27_PASNO